MQLHAFLESLKNAPYITDSVVLFTYDDDRFKSGYQEVMRKFNKVVFIKEQEGRDWWKETILTLIGGAKEYFCWATDDSLFYRRHGISEYKLEWAFKEQNAVSLNLRVGANIKWQNHWYAEKTPDIEILDTLVDDSCGGADDVIVWDAEPLGTQNDFGRVWQNDASIMLRDAYLERLLIEDHWYKGRGCRGLDNVAQSGNIFSPRIAASLHRSVYVNIPVNLVHLLDDGRLYADNFGRFIKQDIFDLQDKFNKGLRIDWERIDFSELDCGRKEVVYDYK